MNKNEKANMLKDFIAKNPVLQIYSFFSPLPIG